ncbi:MAG TPA: hypothetical protein VN639_04460, partial [Azonexus sp.]|nr:hypothetical protein [Azonexus sp.]
WRIHLVIIKNDALDTRFFTVPAQQISFASTIPVFVPALYSEVNGTLRNDKDKKARIYAGFVELSGTSRKVVFPTSGSRR